MSLETKIEKLTNAVELLTRAILERDVVELAANLDAPTTPADSEKVEELVKEETDKAKPAETVDDAPTVEELQGMCLKLVRADKGNKAKILELVGAYKGAKTIAEVPAKKLPELKTKLEAL